MTEHDFPQNEAQLREPVFLKPVRYACYTARENRNKVVAGIRSAGLVVYPSPTDPSRFVVVCNTPEEEMRFKLIYDGVPPPNPFFDFSKL